MSPAITTVWQSPKPPQCKLSQWSYRLCDINCGFANLEILWHPEIVQYHACLMHCSPTQTEFSYTNTHKPTCHRSTNNAEWRRLSRPSFDACWKTPKYTASRRQRAAMEGWMGDTMMVFLAPPWKSAACPVAMTSGYTTDQLWWSCKSTVHDRDLPVLNSPIAAI